MMPFVWVFMKLNVSWKGYLSYVTPGRGIPEIKFRLRNINVEKLQNPTYLPYPCTILYGPACVSHAVFSVKIIEKEKILRQFTDFWIHSARYSRIQFSRSEAIQPAREREENSVRESFSSIGVWNATYFIIVISVKP